MEESNSNESNHRFSKPSKLNQSQDKKINDTIPDNNIQLEVQEFLDQQKSDYLGKRNTNKTYIDTREINRLTDQDNPLQELNNNNKKSNQQVNSQNYNSDPISEIATINILNTKDGQYKTTKKDIISVATHNVRGINNELDQHNIIIEMQNRDINILGLSETKLNINNQNFAFRKSSKYKCFSSAKTENKLSYGSGVAIIMEKELAKHVSRITKIDGHVLALHMFFKKCKICIIQVYLPSNKNSSNNYQRAIRRVITEEIKNKTKIILMGDFNAASNPQTDRLHKANKPISWKPEIEIFNFLEDWAFVDIQKAWEKEEITHTWSNKYTSSRIDYIWLSADIASDSIYSFKNIEAKEITNSDHTLLNIKLLSDKITDNNKKSTTKRKKKTTTIIDSKNATKEQWKEFQEKVDNGLDKTIIDNLIKDYQQMNKNPNNNISIDQENRETTENKLEEIWIIFQVCLIKAAKATLPIKKIKGNNNQDWDNVTNTTPEHKRYRQAFKLLNTFDRIEKSREQKGIIELEEKIRKFNKEIDNTILRIEEEDLTTIEEIKWKEKKKEIKEITITLREEAYITQNVAKMKEINKAIEQRCQYFQDNQRKMIDSLTNNPKNMIQIDRIMVTTEQNKYIETDPKKIKKEVEGYFTKAFKRRKTDFERLSESWKQQYEPRSYIEQEWYKDLMEKPSIQELTEVIKDLPMKKAAGPSQITYEMLKNLSIKAKKRLNNIFHCCFITSAIPKSWKTSNIYPIPKNKEWGAELTNTRPIMLMETTRKCFTKIITNRISTICKMKKVLRGPNFAGLPGESTLEPIQLLNNICEEAREKKKELWILLQDTAKAFDTVNLEMLEKALSRIKIPKKMIKLIIYLFREREVRIITESGLTEPVKAGDGIDQGETISPLLWRIFYDPLLCKIQENHNHGYTMECTWKPNFQISEEKTIQLRTATIAFMDDTTWISRSKENLQKILDEARDFYRANDSQINSNKSILIVINGKEKESKSVQAGLNKELVTVLDNKETTRFLGIWIGSKEHKKATINKIKQDINKIITALKGKKATDKQALYILNRVLLPRIEYKMRHCHLSADECNLLTAQYRRILKNKAEICNTLPNSAIHHKGLLNLKSIWEIQTESQTANLVTYLNDTGSAGISTIIRLKQGQINNWEPKNIIAEEIPITFDSKGNFTAKVLKTANRMNIKIRSATVEDLFQWEGGNFSIQNGLSNNKIYKKSISSLRKRQLMFIDQLIDTDLKILLNWNFIKMLGKVSRRGPEPQWYKIIGEKLTTNGTKLKPNWGDLPWEENNRIFGDIITSDKRKKEWCCSLDKNDNVVWGRTYKKENNEIIVKHYISKNKKKEGTELTQCQGCNIKNIQITDEPCTFRTDKKKLIGCRYINNSKTLNHNKMELPCNTFTLENMAKEELIEKANLNNKTFKSITVTIEPWEIEGISSLVKSETHKQELIVAYRTNMNKSLKHPQTVYEFYTDGSMFNRGQQEVTMGAAWIQTKGPNPGSWHATGVENWPSSTRAETTAITTALLTVPSNSKVTIHTDSQACIDTYNRLNRSSPKQTHKRWLKEKNWSLWSIIIDTTKKRNINLHLNKVKAHAGNVHNEKADQLAKQATQAEIIKWKDTATYKIQALPVWKDIVIDIATRSFVKEVNQKQNICKWSMQKRIQRTFKEQLQRSDNYSWKTLWTNISTKGTWTSFKDSKRRSFLLKLIHNELPTLDRLRIRRPDLYKQDKICPLCNKEDETRDHIFKCEGLESQMSQAWKKTTEKIFKETKKYLLDKKEREEKRTTITSLEEEQIAAFIKNFEEETFRSKQGLFNFVIGLIEQKSINEYKKLLRHLQPKNRSTTTKAKKILASASNKLLRNFRKLVWNYRCEKRIEIDKIKGINLKDKRSKPPYKTRKEKTTRKENEDAEMMEIQSVEDNPLIPEPNNDNGVVEKIYNWIRGGIRWLEI
jgi:ribonuclease HI/endonuclease/exonuclease/phosphatase family metal-dependent hydrolase